jgi:dihydroflavonol-4-reductase
VGEKYILGHRNVTLKEMLDLLATITGLAAPRLRVPHALPLVVGAIDTTLARWTGRSPRVPLEAVRMSRKTMYFDASKAVSELGLPQTDVALALGRAVDWFRARAARAA